MSDPWEFLRQYTRARVALGRAGNGVPTRETLEFQLAHALARDAVHERFESRLLAAEIGQSCLVVRSRAGSRTIYLRRPDLGRRLDQNSRLRLAGMRGDCDAAFVVVDGLSPAAVQRQAVPLLRAVRERLRGWSVAPVVVVERGRVAIGDEIGELLGARLVAVLIGERPGLSSPESLGVYLTWMPRLGRTDAERNCISNIHAGGLSVREAAGRLAALMEESRRKRLTGVELKEEATRWMSA